MLYKSLTFAVALSSCTALQVGTSRPALHSRPVSVRSPARTADVRMDTRDFDAFTLVKSPRDGYEVMVKKGVGYAEMDTAKVFAAAMFGGAYVGMGGMLSMAIAGNIPGIAATNPALVKMTFAALFPINLLMVLMTGCQLFTGNTASMAASQYEGKTGWKDLIKSWTVAIAGNVVGCGLYALAAWYTGLLEGGAGYLAIKTVAAKTSNSFGVTFVKGILCNWLVCMGVYLSNCAEDLTGKMVGIWFPVSCFVAIGFEHSVANLFILPAGLLAGAPISVLTAVTKNLIPAALGNIVGGSIVFAGGMSFLHGKLGQKFSRVK